MTFILQVSDQDEATESDGPTDSPGVVRTGEQAALSVDYNEDGLGDLPSLWLVVMAMVGTQM